jgi:predicted  nucleic acid-binding Zn-ribbon protein
METILTQKLARQRLLQSQKRALLDEYMPIKDELETLEDEIEQLEEELQKIDDVQTDARFDELIKDLNDDGMTEEEYKESLGNDAGKYDEVPQRQPKAWSHADDENDQDR